MADQVAARRSSETVWRACKTLVEAQRHAFNAAMVGRDLPVLFEKAGRHPGQIAGKTPYLQPVHVDAPPALIGTRRASVDDRNGERQFSFRPMLTPDGAPHEAA